VKNQKILAKQLQHFNLLTVKLFTKLLLFKRFKQPSWIKLLFVTFKFFHNLVCFLVTFQRSYGNKNVCYIANIKVQWFCFLIGRKCITYRSAKRRGYYIALATRQAVQKRNQVYKPQEHAIAATKFSVLRGFNKWVFCYRVHKNK